MTILSRLGQMAEQRAVKGVLERRGSAAVSGDSSAANYAGLHQFSLALIPTGPDRSTPRLNLVLSELRPQLFFAGVKSAVQVALELASRLGLPMQIIVLGSFMGQRRTDALNNLIKGHFELTVDVPIIAAANGFQTNQHDAWLVTHWTTAHACGIAARLGHLDPRRVSYLIQDYEPAFYPMSTESALASATYHMGFVPIVNSTPLQKYLNDTESLSIDDASVFRPQIDVDRAADAARRRPESPQKAIAFYARPGTDRNMYTIGRVAVKLCSQELPRDHDVRFISFGETHPRVGLPNGRRLEALGRLDWDDYFLELASTKVLLSLQATPHPSHPPLDAVLSGGRAVTNRIDASRDHLSDRLVAVEPSPERLAGALLDAWRREDVPEQFDATVLDILGAPLHQVLDGVGETLSAS